MVVHNVRDHEGQGYLMDMLRFVVQTSQGTTSITVHILAAADHDGVCAARILAHMLKRESVKYTIVPVTGNTEILNHLEQMDEDDEVRSLVLLNCGASIDFQQKLDTCRCPAELKCFVIDAHRPLLLANLSASSDRVVVLDDDAVLEALGSRPPVDDDDDESGSESGNEDSDGEKENVWDPDAPGGQVRPPGLDASGKRERKRKREDERYEKTEMKRLRVAEYYLNSYYATPAAMSLFKMAQQTSTPSQDLIWLAAVSLTGYYDLGLINSIDYGKMVWEDLKEALDRLDDVPSTSTTAPSQSSAGDAAAAAAGDTALDPASDEDIPAPAPLIRPPRRKKGRQGLRFENDLRLTLYKHWTLERSLMHSSYFYGTLELHRESGLRSLKNFFATAGIAPHDFGQLFSAMDLPVKKALSQKFEKFGPAYGLQDQMFLHQFVRNLGPLSEGSAALTLHELSCMDAVLIINALLGVVPIALSPARLEQLPQTADGRRDGGAIDEMERDANVENFWRAYTAISCKEPAMLAEGIQAAVEVAKGVEDLSRLLIDTKALRLSSSKQFRWVKIEYVQPAFRHYLTVRRLAVWLLHVLFTYRPNVGSSERPLLVIVRDKVRDTYLCVGASPARLAERNEFGSRYRAVLRVHKTLRYRYDFFDKSMIEIAREDWDRFWEALVETPI